MGSQHTINFQPETNAKVQEGVNSAQDAAQNVGDNVKAGIGAAQEKVLGFFGFIIVDF